MELCVSHVCVCVCVSHVCVSRVCVCVLCVLRGLLLHLLGLLPPTLICSPHQPLSSLPFSLPFSLLLSISRTVSTHLSLADSFSHSLSHTHTHTYTHHGLSIHLFFLSLFSRGKTLEPGLVTVPLRGSKCVCVCVCVCVHWSFFVSLCWYAVIEFLIQLFVAGLSVE